MVSGVLHRSLLPPSAVTAGCCVRYKGVHAVVLHQDTCLTCWKVGSDGLEQTATWRAPDSLVQLVHLPSGHLLLLSEGGNCYLHSWHDEQAAAGASAAPSCEAYVQLQAPADSSSSQVQAYGCVVSTNVLSASSDQGIASLTAVAYMPGVLHIIKACALTSDSKQAAACSSSGESGSSNGGGSAHLQAKAMALTHALQSCHHPGGELPALASVRVHTRVLALTWLDPAEQQLDVQGRSLLAVLHEYAVGGNPPVLHVDCVCVNWLEGTLSPGPWSIRNVHPTTRLLQPFPGSATLPPGVLLISSRDVQLCTCLGASLPQQQDQDSWQQQAATSSAAAQAAAAADPSGMHAALCVRQHEVARWALGGLPLSCAVLSDGCWLVGDNRAGLHLLQLTQTSNHPLWMQLQVSGYLAIPDILVHVPLPPQQQQQADEAVVAGQRQQQYSEQLSALLFVGSRCSSTQVVGLPHSLTKAALPAQAMEAAQQQQQVLPILQSALLPSLAGAQAVAVYKDPSGALPEQQLLVACGVAPRGKLAVVRSGCGLVPLLLDGPELPGDAVLFAIQQPTLCQHKQRQQQAGPVPHSMLGFSFPSANASSVMSLEGTTFRQLQLAGLHQQGPSHLLATLPGGWLLQVTACGVRLLDMSADGQLHSQWTPTGGSISLASACGSVVAVSCGCHLTCVTVGCCQGTCSVVATAELQQQASALGLFRLQGGQLMVAAGLWVDNTIVLMTWPHQAATLSATQQQQQAPSQLQVVCSVALGADQPRSIALLPVGAADVLLVGNNTGKVLMWELCRRADHQQQQQGSMALRHARSVQVSNTSVSLQSTWLPVAAEAGALQGSSSSSSLWGASAVPCVCAHASTMAVFKPNLALLEATGLQPQAAAGVQPAGGATASVAPAGVGATMFVDVRRLCGSEACLAASFVHTPDMPFSLAWVSNTHRLCFGSVSAQHKLRWRSCGLPSTPLALCVHHATNTLVLLLAADNTCPDAAASRHQQQLVVLDAATLQVLLTVALAPGHAYTMLTAVDLPATSQQQQQQEEREGSQPGPIQSLSGTRAASSAGYAAAGSSATGMDQQQQPDCSSGHQRGCLPFIVLGSHAVIAASDTGVGARWPSASGTASLPRVKRVGLLSFFELTKRVVPSPALQQQQQAGSGSELRYELILHGMVPLSVTPASACTVLPQTLAHCQRVRQQHFTKAATQRHSASAGSSGATAGVSSDTAADAAVGQVQPGRAAAEGPLLVVGSEAGVTLLRVCVDDAWQGAQQQLEQLLAEVAQVSVDGPSGPQQQQQQEQQQPCLAPPAPHGTPRALSRGWQYGRVSVQELSTAPAGLQGVVTKLSSSGSSVVALESLGPVTTYMALAEQPGGWVQLLPVGQDDRSGLAAVDFTLQPLSGAAPAQPGGGAAAVVDGAAALAAAAAGTQSQAAQQQQQHQAILVATHPAGLLLLQRDLQQEAGHVNAMLLAAQRDWEAGHRPDSARSLGKAVLLREGLVPAVPTWQGGGEAAPWAGDNPMLELPVQGVFEAAGGMQEAAARQLLASVAARAAGTPEPVECVEPDWLGLMTNSPGLAPVMVPSAACAPAPGSMLLCEVQLGLHPALSTPAAEEAGGQHTHSCLDQGLSGGVPASSTVLCLSASGAVSAAQLLTPAQTTKLVAWQQHLSDDGRHSPGLAQLLQWGQLGVGPSERAQSPDAAAVAKALLRGLRGADAAASYENYDRAPGALAVSSMARPGVLPVRAGQQEVQDRVEPVGAVEGDVLMMMTAVPPDSKGASMQEAAAMQHRLWQLTL